MTTWALRHQFVEQVPDDLDPGVLYVSMEFRTTMHLCACGCGNNVVLPLRRSGWRIVYDGEAVSMSPSVGNWSFPCRSHYWIQDGRIQWAGEWTDDRVAAGRERTLMERGARVDIAPVETPDAATRRPWYKRLLDAIFVR